MLLDFLIIVCALSVFQIVRKIISQRKCLEDEIFDEYKKNRLPSNERRRVTQHLGLCKKCQEKMLKD